MVRPERRTKADIMAAVTITVVIAAVASLIWWASDAQATHSRPAAIPAPNPTPAREVPATFNQLWTAASPATTPCTGVPFFAGFYRRSYPFLNTIAVAPSMCTTITDSPASYTSSSFNGRAVHT